MRKFFTVIIMMVCTLILLTACGGTKYTYDAVELASFRLNSDGTVSPYIDSSKANKIAKECSDGDLGYMSLSLLLSEGCKFTVEPNENVKAGDTVKATFEYDKKALKEYGISFTNTTFDYVMEGSLNTETVNIQTAPTTVMTTEKAVETESESEAQAENVVYEEYDVWDNIFVSCAGNSDNNEYNEIFANFSEINYPAGFPKYVLAKYVFVDEDGNETDVLSHIAPGTKLTVKAYPYDDMLSEINKLGYTITPSTRTVTLPADVADKWYELSLE